MTHRPEPTPYGENIASSEPFVGGALTTLDWYSEIEFYNYTNPDTFDDAGHFTQLVWKNSKEIGIGIAVSKLDGDTYIVANYYPPGNYPGKYEENVLKPHNY